jgi:hypothetical protein
MRGGLSAKAARTVRQGIVDCPHPCRGPPGLSRRLSEKGNITSRDAPRITDCPRGARGLFARHPRTVRPAHADCPPGTRGLSARHTRTIRNLIQLKLKTTTDRKQRRARTQRTHDEHCARGPSARALRTVREARTELKTARP